LVFGLRTRKYRFPLMEARLEMEGPTGLGLTCMKN
jgi:hypothetical protein